MKYKTWKWFLGLQKDSLKKILSIVLMGTCQSALVSLIPLLIRSRVNHAIPDLRFSGYLPTIAVISLAYLVSTFISLITKRIGIKFVKQQSQALGTRLIETLYKIPLSDIHDQRKTHLHTLIFQDRDRIDGMFQGLILNAVPAFLIIGILLLVLVSINWQVSAALILVFPLVKLFTHRTRQRLRVTVERSRNSFRIYNQGLMRSLSLLELTRMYAAEPQEIKKRKSEMESLGADQLELGWGESILLGQQALIFSVLCLVIAFLMTSTQTSTLSGDLLSFYVALALLRGQLSTIGAFLVPWRNGNLALDSAYRFVVETKVQNPYQGQTQIDFQGDIRIENLSFGYQSEKLISGLSFHLRRGQSLILSGKNGAGKTTLLKLILGVISPQEGRLFADGIAYQDLDLSELRHRIGMAPQDPILFSGTIRENISYGMEAGPEILNHVVEVTGLRTFIDSLSQGLDTYVGENGFKLSGGQRQRIGIARALARKPALLILDEPSNNLGVEDAIQIVCKLREWNPFLSLIVVSHDRSFYSLAELHLDLSRCSTSQGRAMSEEDLIGIKRFSTQGPEKIPSATLSPQF